MRSVHTSRMVGIVDKVLTVGSLVERRMRDSTNSLYARIASFVPRMYLPREATGRSL
jgi:hypothetical protein